MEMMLSNSEEILRDVIHPPESRVVNRAPGYGNYWWSY